MVPPRGSATRGSAALDRVLKFRWGGCTQCRARAGDRRSRSRSKSKSKTKKTDTEQPIALGRGVTVDYDTRDTKGSGFVFWVGKNEYGPGLRAGIKDAKSGETVWAAEDQLTVTKAAEED